MAGCLSFFTFLRVVQWRYISKRAYNAEGIPTDSEHISPINSPLVNLELSGAFVVPFVVPSGVSPCVQLLEICDNKFKFCVLPGRMNLFLRF